MWVDEDGGEWPAYGYYDSELGVDCDARSWTEERCLPPSSVQWDDDHWFADERCTEPAARVTPSAWRCRVSDDVPVLVWRVSCAHAVGTIGSASDRAQPPGLYRLGEPLAGPLYELDETTGACVPRYSAEGVTLFRLEPADLDALAVVYRALE